MIAGQPKLILRMEGPVLFAASPTPFLYLKQFAWIIAGLFLVSMAACFGVQGLAPFHFSHNH